MNVFTFNEIYNIVRAQAAANSSNGIFQDWSEFYPEADYVSELILKFPKNNTFEQDISNAATLLQADFDALEDTDDPEELEDAHRLIENKLPSYLDQYIE